MEHIQLKYFLVIFIRAVENIVWYHYKNLNPIVDLLLHCICTALNRIK